MENESAIKEKTGLFASAWRRLKTLPSNAKAQVVDVARSTKKMVQDDPRRVIHSLKVGLALTLVSLLYYTRTLYDSFGVAGMWAVLTVVVVFEFSVGGTLSKSLNRGFATLLAGALGVGAQHLASLFGEEGEPVVLGILVFLLAAVSTFTRFFPRIKARYDYGVLIFILTFSLVSVSGYRVEQILELANQRLSTILVGGATCMVVSVCICPVWAGEDLHKLVASNIEKLANYLEGLGEEYFQYQSEDGKTVSKTDDSYLKQYKTVLNSKSTEESLANLARWEPRHGKFGFRHPWKQYLKIGVQSRQCAYLIEALNGCLNSKVQAPQQLKTEIQELCQKMSEESGKTMKSLSEAIKTMTYPSPANVHIENSKNAIKELKIALKACSLDHEEDLQEIVPAATIVSILIEIVTCVDKLTESVHELSNLAHFKKVESTVSPEKPQLLHRGTVKPVLDSDTSSVDHIIITVHETHADVSADNIDSQTVDNKSGRNEEL